MWNLLNVMQILAYMRFYSKWPAFMMSIFTWIDNAVTLKPVSDAIKDYGKSKFELANQTLSDEGLRNSGVTDPDLVQSLGMFGLVLFLMLILVGIYCLLYVCAHKIPFITKLKDFIYSKLFYNGFLRYMIVSYLKLSYTVWGFFFVFYGFDT